VDAVEGPLEQTLESIRAVKEARVSMIVAINKIDKPGADIEATKKALYEAGVQVILNFPDLIWYSIPCMAMLGHILLHSH
jgi:translation initiation factor IF-2